MTEQLGFDAVTSGMLFSQSAQRHLQSPLLTHTIMDPFARRTNHLAHVARLLSDKAAIPPVTPMGGGVRRSLARTLPGGLSWLAVSQSSSRRRGLILPPL